MGTLLSKLAYADYAAIDAVSRSHLEAFRRSPAHYKAAIKKDWSDTPDLLVGRALHTLVLEPEKFDAEFVCAPQLDRRTKVGKEQWADLQSSGKSVLTAQQMEMVNQMCIAIGTHASAGAILGADDGEPEVTLQWQDRGVECKGRLDFMNRRFSTIVDVKTTLDASPIAFARTIADRGYHRQAAFYMRGAQSLGVEIENYVLIAVEKAEPYAVGVYRLGVASLGAAWEELDGLLDRFLECKAADKWPAYGDDVSDLDVPAWAI